MIDIDTALLCRHFIMPIAQRVNQVLPDTPEDDSLLNRARFRGRRIQ